MTEEKKPIHVEGGVVPCGDGGMKHWHAEVRFSDAEPVSSYPCDTEEQADEVLTFAREVVYALMKVTGSTVHTVSEGTAKVQ